VIFRKRTMTPTEYNFTDNEQDPEPNMAEPVAPYNHAPRISIVPLTHIGDEEEVLEEIKEPEVKEPKRDIDLGGIVFSTLGTVFVLAGVVSAFMYGFFLAKRSLVIRGAALDLGGFSVAPFLITIGIIFLGIFVLWEQGRERQYKKPLVSMQFLEKRKRS
jgi:hypothetical protein